MDEKVILYFIFAILALFVMVVIAFFVIKKKGDSEDEKYIRKLREGTKTNKISSEILYQKLYVTFLKIPYIRRYVIKIRRRLEILNVEDEYLTRMQTSKVMTKAMLILLPITIFIILVCRKDILLMGILLLSELFMIETLIESMVDKIDNKLLKQQIEFFAEMRHAYHEYNMVEEAIYQVSQNDELEVSRQAEKIYEILLSDNPEVELEKYYDVAPNSYLKEFAGISYLTKEFGDREIDGGSLYLKNLTNITQEMQIEILKRDKLNYKFQSLSLISAIPLLFLEPLKNWAVSNFSFTNSFYGGKGGMIVQIIIIILTFACYLLIRKVKEDNSSSNANFKNTENPWQAKLYKNKFVKKIVDLFIPKKGTKDYRKMTTLLKDAASKQKIEWVYINKIVITIVVFFVSLFTFNRLHKVAVDYMYTEPTTSYDIIGEMSESDEIKAMALTEQDNYFLDKFKGRQNVGLEEIKTALRNSDYYKDSTDDAIDEAAERILNKLNFINNEYMQWFEVLLAFAFAAVGYMTPTWLLMFQVKMRQLGMEDEVMQFHTIILMLMKIERVSVEIILEWLERYSNIFKEPLTKCINNYESGAWEALEELKNDVSFPQMIRIVESMQAAVEKIPIEEAFDELDTERMYYQEKRKDSNERLISKKGLIGRVLGFAPMICLFVCYLIVPLVVIGLLSMTNAFNTMSSMM